MTLVVLGIDALDPQLVSSEKYPNLALQSNRSISTINSSVGKPSTHELWPTIITGLRPEEHGIMLDDGVAWESPVLRLGSRLANYIVPDHLQTRIGGWLLNHTEEDAFRTRATYYEKKGIRTVFDDRTAKAIGIPNYVVDKEVDDREHQLRRQLGDLLERAPGTKEGHRSANPLEFYEQCMEMTMIRIARIRRALRSREYELVFGYTSGLDLIGHVSHSRPELQYTAYEELDEFVGELRGDLHESDELILVSDHGLRKGVHTDEAMIAGTTDAIQQVDGVSDVRHILEDLLEKGDHESTGRWGEKEINGQSEEVRQHLEDLGYI